MSQNIYDNPAFFAGYQTLPRSVKGLDGAPEWPRLRSFIPDLTGTRVLDLGSGFGWFSRWARTAGAASVHGMDLSQNMLDRARAMTDDPNIAYQQADLDSASLPTADNEAHDVVFSSLLLHYLANLQGLVKEVHRVLKPGGVFTFSIEHPVYTAPSRAEFMTDSQSGQKYWPLNGYQMEGLRVTSWLADGVQKQHRTLTTYINALLSGGFELRDFHEWYPNEAELQNEEMHEVMERPIFLLMSVVKK